MQISIRWLLIEKICLVFFSAILWILPFVSTVSFLHQIHSNYLKAQIFPNLSKSLSAFVPSYNMDLTIINSALLLSVFACWFFVYYA